MSADCDFALCVMYSHLVPESAQTSAAQGHSTAVCRALVHAT